MIYSIQGKVKIVGEDFLVIQDNNLAYQVFVNDFILHKTKAGQEIELFTYLHNKEETIDLYGFQDETELSYFKRLNGISGIGPKSAMNVLSLVKISDLERAILSENVNILTKVSGIGRKTAERIILELKGKILKTVQSSEGSADETVIEALTAMGYPLAQARIALRKIDPKIKDTQKKIKAGLKIINKNK